MTNATDEANDFLNSTGVMAAEFSDVGTVVRGTVTAAEVWNRLDFASKKKLYWDDGNPRQQLVVTIQTEERENAEDNGLRRLYAKKPGSMLDAIQEAVGSRGIAVGGKLTVKYEGDGEAAQKGWNPPKLYRARYEPPTIAVDNFDNPPAAGQPWDGGAQQEIEGGPPGDTPPADLYDDLPF